MATVSYEGGEEYRNRGTFKHRVLSFNSLNCFSCERKGIYLRAPRLAVVVTSEGRQGEREGEKEDNEGGDDEAEDAVVLPSAGEEAAVVSGREGLSPVLHEYVVEPPGAQRVILCYANSNFVMQRSSPTPTLQDWRIFISKK